MRPFAVLVAASLLVAGTARAATGDSGPDYDPGKQKRRSDFAAGISFNAAFGSVSGYPNDAAKIGLPQYHDSSGPAGGAAYNLWLGGALRDWLVVGLVLSGTTVGGSGTLSQGGAFGVHLEGFPLFYKGGVFRDLALVGDFGVGNRKINRASEVVVDGGAASYLAVGVLYDGFRLGKHFSGGPIIQVAAQFSDTVSATFVTGGYQIAFYGG